jgi:hypothetical protein
MQYMKIAHDEKDIPVACGGEFVHLVRQSLDRGQLLAV